MTPKEYVFNGLRQSVYDSEPLRQVLARHLDLPDIDRITIERESIDARKKPDVYHIYNLRFTVSRPAARLQDLLSRQTITEYAPGRLLDAEPHLVLPENPIVIGFGPAGMFAGLYLARMGYKPVIFERGEAIGDRVRSVQDLWEHGVLDPESNMQFGEGGAGTFSDGKLSTGKASALDQLILEAFVAAGAPETILYHHKPHIGTDNLRRVVVNLRNEITGLGGEVHFGHKLTGLHIENGAVKAVTVSGSRMETTCVILAIGHSARDTVRMLHELGIPMEAKPLAIGARIEHPAGFINERQYGKKAAAVMPAADYKLTHQHQGAGIYSFCMCPGGQVVCASSEPGGVVTNGMSRYARDEAWSNSAIVAGIEPHKVGIRSPLEAIEFQRELEQRAFELGGGGYTAPAQRASDFLAAKVSDKLGTTSYRPGVVAGPLHMLLPSFIVEGMKAALARFDRIMPGFIANGVLIGPETRTSSPVRILRDEDCRSVSVEGLYLLGEGAGYAGGIMTCARDAVKWARLVKSRA
jgi:uncharacterized FAD-dependent dehydrogenase